MISPPPKSTVSLRFRRNENPSCSVLHFVMIANVLSWVLLLASSIIPKVQGTLAIFLLIIYELSGLVDPALRLGKCRSHESRW